MLIFSFAACKKKEKEDTSSPRVMINSPATGASYNMYDTIAVNATVSDETQLTSVLVGLTNANNASVQYSYSVPLQGNSFTFNIQYYLVDLHLPSDFYYLTVWANDGTNTTTTRTKIYITAAPTVHNGFFITTAAQPKQVLECDVYLATQNTISLATGFAGMAFNSYHQQLYINGNINQPFSAYDAVMNGTTWSYPYDNSGLPLFTCVATDGTKAYIGYYSGDVGSATYTGVPSTSYSTGSMTLYPYYFTLTGSYGVGVFKDKFGGSDKIYTFHRSSGMVQNYNFMPIAVTGIFERTQDQLYIFGNNSSGSAVYYLYNVLTNGLQGPFTLPAAKLLSAEQVNSDYLLLGLDDGKIYGFQYSTSNMTVLTNVKAQQLIYNADLGAVFAASNNTIYSYSISTNYVLTLNAAPFVSDSIIAFEVVTNK